MEIAKLVNSYLSLHAESGKACWKQGGCCKMLHFDNLLQIALIQEVLTKFEWNFSCTTPFGRQIILPNLMLLYQPEGLLQPAANSIFLQQAVFSAAERMKLQWNNISSIPQVFFNILLEFLCLQQIQVLQQPAATLKFVTYWLRVSTQIHLNWQAGQSLPPLLCWKRRSMLEVPL